MEELTIQEQIQAEIQVILEQNETEMYYRTYGIAPENYSDVAKRILELFEKLQANC